MTSCQEIVELLDAYALGASDRAEGDAIERHIADCVRCWEELNKAQQTAALIALSAPLTEAPPRVAERLLAAAQRDIAGIRIEPRPGVFQRLRVGWGMTAAGSAAIAAVAVFSSFQMQGQVSDLEDENTSLKSEMRSTTFGLQQQLSDTGSQLAQQAILVSVISDDESKEIEVMSDNGDASATYRWSPGTGAGYVECDGMPTLQPGKVYQLWITTSNHAYPLSTFQTENGWCQITTDLSFLEARPAGIGISVEDLPGGVDSPSDGWAMYAHFSND